MIYEQGVDSLKVYILEKPGRCLDQMLSCLTEDKGVSGIYVFEDYIQLIDQIGIYMPEFCIIRVGLAGFSGLRVAEMVKQCSPASKIIIVSESRDYALEAYEIGVYGYLLCPLEKNKFDKIMFERGR